MATLLISIPTYNRAEELGAQLRNLGLAHTLGARFKVAIFDNASEDKTPEVVEAARRHGFPIEYHRHPANIGYQSNVVGVFKRALLNAPDDWLWVLSDDDIVQPARVSALCDHIYGAEAMSLVLVPFVTYTDTGQIISHPVPPAKGEIGEMEEAWSLVHQTTLISSWIYRTGPAFRNALPQVLEQGHNTYVQVFLSALLLKEHRKFGILSHPVGFELANLTWRFRIRETFFEDKVSSLHLTRLILGLSSPGPMHFRRKMHRFFLRRCLYWVAAGEREAASSVFDAMRAEPLGLASRLLRTALRALILCPEPFRRKLLFPLRRRYERACMAREMLRAMIG